MRHRLHYKTKTSPVIVAGTICCFAACTGDFLVTSILGFISPGYSFLNQSQSILGSSNSPVSVYMKIWGVIFSLLFVAYGIILKHTSFSKGFWQKMSAWLFIIYGLGEGIGSGLFPYDHIGTALTISGKLHSLFSGIGVAALVCLSFVLLKVYPKKIYSRMNSFISIVSFSSLALIVVFLFARQNLIPWKGLWQRLFLVGYYSLFLVIAYRQLPSHLPYQSYKNKNRI